MTRVNLMFKVCQRLFVHNIFCIKCMVCTIPLRQKTSCGGLKGLNYKQEEGKVNDQVYKMLPSCDHVNESCGKIPRNIVLRHNVAPKYLRFDALY